MKKKFQLGLCTILLTITHTTLWLSTIKAQWYTIDGGGTYGLNSTTAIVSSNPSAIAFNEDLYVIWKESYTSSKDQVHIKKYNGSSWTAVGNTPSQSQLNITSATAADPKIVSCNGYLYAAWQENDDDIFNIHVKRYDGSTWQFFQNYSTGDGRSNINAIVTANAKSVELIAFNNELYAAWVEEDGDGDAQWQLRVSKFDGSLWTSIDGGGTYGLNKNTSYDAYIPRLGVHDNSLYLTWTENNSSGIPQVRIRRYDGGSTWTFIDGNGSDGLNYAVAKIAGKPFIASYNNNLYLYWGEINSSTAKNMIRVKRYDGSTWHTDVDGGGWNYAAEKAALNPSCLVANNLLYVSWEENYTSGHYQIRVASFDGTTKTFVDGNGTYGINFNTSKRAVNSKLVEIEGNLCAVWDEDNDADDNWIQQIRAKQYLLSPYIKSVTVPADGAYTVGQAMDFTVNFSKAVHISGGTPYIPLTLNTGGTVNADYVSGSGSAALIFRYTVVPGNVDNDGITVGSSITLPSGCTMQSADATPLDAGLTLNSVGSATGILVDASVPTVFSVSSTTADGAYNTGDVIAIRVTFSEAVTVTGTPTLALNSGGMASYSSGSGSTVLTFNYTVGSGHSSADLDYAATNSLSLAGGTIKDAAGNAAILTLPAVGSANSLGGQKAIVIDNVAPSVTLTSSASNPTNASPIPVTIAFSESVTGFDASDITVSNGAKGTLSGSGASYSINITPSAQGTVTVNVAAGVATDAAGNTNTAATQLSRTFSNTAPTVNIASSAGNPTNASPIPVTITFSESVTGFDASDITVSNGAKGFLNGSGASYSINITPSAQGTVAVDIAAGVAQSAAGNENLAATPFSITFDNSSPSVSISSSAGNPTNVSPIPVTIAFSEDVTGFGLEDVTVSNGSASGFTGSGSTYTLDITPSAQGTVTVNIAAGAASDAAGNTNTGAEQWNITYTTSYIISGNAGVAGVALSYTDGTLQTVESDDNGSYSIIVPADWSGTVTPQKTGFTFSPENRSYSNVLSSQVSQDYTATAITFTISGNAGIGGATLSYTDGSAQTVTADDDGNYSFTVSYNWSGTVTPAKTDYTFEPVSIAYSDVLSGQTGQNYVATLSTDIEDMETTSVRTIIYPTVNQGMFKINMTNPETGKVFVKIINLSGVTIKEYRFDKSLSVGAFDINITGTATGQYIIEINMDDYRDVQKIIIE